MTRNAEPTSSEPRIVGTATAFPGPRHAQSELLDAFHLASSDCEYDRDLAEYFFDAVEVDGRHLALDPPQYAELGGFGEANAAYVQCGTELGARALTDAARDAEVELAELDALFFTTVTGIASPSIDAKIFNERNLARDVDRVPMFGLGCVGGAAGIARVADYLRGHPESTAALVSVELCSLTLERNNPGVEDLIAAALFGDGAASAVCDGARVDRECRGLRPRIHGSRSFLHPDTEWVMGWEMGDAGFELILSGELPHVIESELGGDLRPFLDSAGLDRREIDRWISHPGGPRVLDAVESALELGGDALSSARESLRRVGNLSSASVLDVLDGELDVCADWGGPAVLMAMGPGFSVEFVLLEGER